MSDGQQQAVLTERVSLEGAVTAYTPAPTGPESPAHAPAGTRPALYVSRGPLAGETFVLDGSGTTVLGRHSDCGIVLSDVTVSRRHAEVRPVDDGFTLTDLGSLNGSYVNRKPIDTVALADGDEIAVGVFRLVFRAQG